MCRGVRLALEKNYCAWVRLGPKQIDRPGKANEGMIKFKSVSQAQLVPLGSSLPNTV